MSRRMGGIPYASAEFDELGYHVVCPVCGTRCRDSVRHNYHDDGTEDAITKGANAVYAEHYLAAHEEES